MSERQFKSIVVETEEYGTLYLRPSLLVKDSKSLSQLQKSDFSAREFTVQAISRLVYSPEIDAEEIRLWDDSLLIQVAMIWAKEKGGLEWPLSEDLPPFEAFKHGHAAYLNNLAHHMAESIEQIYVPLFRQASETANLWVNALNQQLDDVNKQILESVQSSINSLAEAILGSVRDNISSIVQSVTLDINVGRFFPALPELSELRKRFEEMERAADVLDESGYRFMRSQWLLNEISQFVGIEQIDPRVRGAAITNRVLGLTRSDEFTATLEHYFDSSTVLQRRWGIIKQALDAHRNRSYAISIPTLLAQLEGIFTDALILKNMVIRQNGKLYAKDSNGNVKLNKHGKPIRLHGLGQKVQNSSFRDDDILIDLVEFLANTLVIERNDILHGNSVDYDKAKLSVQLMLAIYFLAAEFAEFESRN